MTTNRTDRSTDRTTVQHPLLTETEALVRGAFLEEVFVCAGRRWKLRTLEYEDERWADSFTDGRTLYAVGRSRSHPAVAASLVAIGPLDEHEALVPVETLFPLPASMSAEERQRLADPVAERTWRREQILAWLSSSKIPFDVVEQLANGVLRLARRRQEVLQQLGPFEIAPITGLPSGTSSLEKGS